MRDVGCAVRPAGSANDEILILYYYSYGHVETMAWAKAEGVRTGGGEAVVKRVPELVPLDIAKQSGFKFDQPAPIVAVDEGQHVATMAAKLASAANVSAAS